MPPRPRGRPWAVTALLAAGAGLLPGPSGPCRAADTLVLRGGKRIQVESWWRSGDTVRYRKYGGTVGIPWDSVLEVLPGDDGSDELAGAPASARSYAEPGARGTPAPGPSPGPVAPPSAGEARAATDAGELEAQLASLSERIRSHPEERSELHGRMAVLWTRLGNVRYRDQDVPGARAAYETAVTLDPSLPEAQLNLASAYLTEGRNTAALREIDVVLGLRPDHVQALELRGEALYRLERLDAAIRAWTRAQEITPTDRVAARLEKAVREQEVGGEYLRSDGAHFTVRFDGGVTDGAVGREIVAYLEEQFGRLVSRYDHLPPAMIVVILYPARQFHDVTQTPDWTGGLFDGKIRVPIGGLQGMTDALRDVLVHELTHSFVDSKSRGAASRWMHEGLAQFEEGQRVSPGTVRALAREFRQEREGWGNTLSYAGALGLTRFLIERYGFGSMVAILAREGDGMTENEAFRRVLGIDRERALHEWGQALLRGENP